MSTKFWSSKTFPQFKRLPPELQLMVWEAASKSPSMHVFDVCFPSAGRTRSQLAFVRDGYLDQLSETSRARYYKTKDTVFLDALIVGHEAAGSDTDSQLARYRVDPSMYTFHNSLRAACIDSHKTMGSDTVPDSENVHTHETNTVYLPGPHRRIRYNNETDVLHLRFGNGPSEAAEFSSDVLEKPTSELILSEPASIFDGSSPPESTALLEPLRSHISSILESQWHPSMAETLRAARRIALDANATHSHFTQGAAVVEEIVFFACTLQQDLEVLYLVDYCVGRCRTCAKGSVKAAKDLRARGGALDMNLHGMEDQRRSPDVIQGVGKVYQEVFDLEKLGWSECHPTFAFAKILSEAIRDQQAEAADGQAVFKGVRVLVAQDVDVDGADTSMAVDCGRREPNPGPGVSNLHD